MERAEERAALCGQGSDAQESPEPPVRMQCATGIMTLHWYTIAYCYARSISPQGSKPRPPRENMASIKRIF